MRDSNLARQITDAHEGTIQAVTRKDDKGKVLGARFIVKLPLAQIPK